jgi:hypothetical protein
MLITHLHTRLLHPALAQLTDPDPPAPSTCAPPHATTNVHLTNSPRRPDSPHDTKLDSIKPTSSALALLAITCRRYSGALAIRIVSNRSPAWGHPHHHRPTPIKSIPTICLPS